MSYSCVYLSALLTRLNWLFSLVNIARIHSLALNRSASVYQLACMHYLKHFCTFNIRTLPYDYEWILFALAYAHTHFIIYVQTHTVHVKDSDTHLEVSRVMFIAIIASVIGL